jgi:pantoate--beta-alanine ligase
VDLITSLSEMRRWRNEQAETVGLVPTMGYLHEGHTSLIRQARSECSRVVVTLFVNPTQFGPSEDFATYPRDMARDRQLAADAGADLMFAPATEDVYPPGFATYVEVGPPASRWEGERRPGHFRGVATVVTKLFTMTRPNRAYFGEKDYQQLQVVRRLSADLNLGVDVVACPTVRESDGLALSSRNVYLTPEERPRAVGLYRGLQAAQAALSEGERDARRLERCIAEEIAARGLTLDYAAVVDPISLEPLDRVDRPARALVTARIGRVRLIDNAPLTPG